MPCYNSVANWVLKLGLSVYEKNAPQSRKYAGISHHLDISHTLGNCMKHVYGKDPEFTELTEKLGKIRLRYHLTDKAWLLPPNMRAMARFMNLREWVAWALKMLGCLDSLDDELKEAYGFLLQYKELIEELGVCVETVSYLETICMQEGFGFRTNALCQHHIIRNLIGNANNRRACMGLRMLDYFKTQSAMLNGTEQIRHISTDIIESYFGLLKAKVSPNKLYGFTPMVLILPLYPKITVYSDAENHNFKVRLANVKLKDIDLWAKKNLSPNRVALRSKTLNKAS